MPNRRSRGTLTSPWPVNGVQRAVSRPVDWLLLGRYALLIALTALIPIPLLDRGVENYLRRRLVRAVAGRHGITLSEEAVAVLGNAPSGGCLGCLWSVVVWPFRKILKTVLVVFQVKAMADTASEILHRGLLLEEALEMGWLPGDPIPLRQAMDRSLEAIDTRPVERSLLGVFLDHKSELNKVVYNASQEARERLRQRERPREHFANKAEGEGFSEEAEEMSAALVAALRGTGVVPELLHWFRAEMGAPAGSPIAVEGVLEPEEVLPPDETAPEEPDPPQLTDAIEIDQEPG